MIFEKTPAFFKRRGRDSLLKMPAAADHKLRNAAAFSRVREGGRFAECGGFRVCCLAYAERLPGRARRFGVVASKKSVGDAVRRNRAKRVFRELFRAHAALLPPLCDVAVMTRAGYAREDFAALSARFAKACAQLSDYFCKHAPVLKEAPPMPRGRKTSVLAADESHAG